MDEHRKDARQLDEEPDAQDVETTPEGSGQGEILGISRSGGDRDQRHEKAHEAGRRDPDVLEDERDRPHVGSRDVSEGTTGGTGPDTGGSGVFRRGSGATGTDIGGQ